MHQCNAHRYLWKVYDKAIASTSEMTNIQTQSVCSLWFELIPYELTKFTNLGKIH